MQFQIVPPTRILRERTEAPADNHPTPQRDSLGVVRMRMQLAIESVDNLLEAARARERCGTWKAPGAANLRDFGVLSDAEESLKRHRKRR
jgi:hypothetical protein